MKKLFGITLLSLLALLACDSARTPSINPALNNDGETVCSRYYNAPHLGTTYRSSYYVEAEGGEIISITRIQTWDIDGLSDEEVDTIFASLGPAIWFEYEIDGDVLIKSSPLSRGFNISGKSEGEINEELRSAIEFFGPYAEVEYEVDGDFMMISGFRIETWDISDKSEEEIRELIDSFGSPIAFEYEIDDKTLTRIGRPTLEGFEIIQGNLRLETFVTRFEDNVDGRGYICE